MTTTGPSSPIVVPDLVNGQAYKARVRSRGPLLADGSRLVSAYTEYTAPFTPAVSG